MVKLNPKHVVAVYLSWNGRIGRGEFWAYGVVLNIVWMLVAALLTLAPSPAAEFASLAWYAVLIVFYLASWLNADMTEAVRLCSP